MLHASYLFSKLSCAGLSLIIIASTGCASKSPRDPTLADAPRTVSALEYGFVRPAIDVAVTGATAPRARPVRGSQTNLWERVRHGKPLDIQPHPRVARQIQHLLREPSYLNALARRARPYLHLIVTELEQHAMPSDLALLPDIESGYNPRAVSPMRAAGLWQFMPDTGRIMGLEQNAWYDGRFDILASTRGAIMYLKELRQTFDGDWALALAAYNAGIVRVRAAQAANLALDKPTDYWSLDLPAETEAYVPKLLAAIALVRHPERHGLTLPAIPNQPAIDIVQVRQGFDLAQAARACDLPVDTLRALNPGLKRDVTGAEGVYPLLVPRGLGTRLRAHLANHHVPGQPTLAGAIASDPGDS